MNSVTSFEKEKGYIFLDKLFWLNASRLDKILECDFERFCGKKCLTLKELINLL